jgi:phage shock protein PspC (stress-responsive transcriptional regulator)
MPSELRVILSSKVRDGYLSEGSEALRSHVSPVAGLHHHRDCRSGAGQDQGLRLAVAGVACGLAAAFGLTRLIASFLFGVTAWDPLVFLVVPVILVAVAIVAVWLPAMRASRVDPNQALRYE